MLIRRALVGNPVASDRVACLSASNNPTRKRQALLVLVASRKVWSSSCGNARVTIGGAFGWPCKHEPMSAQLAMEPAVSSPGHRLVVSASLPGSVAGVVAHVHRNEMVHMPPPPVRERMG
jgi:hypothetical protein